MEISVSKSEHGNNELLAAVEAVLTCDDLKSLSAYLLKHIDTLPTGDALAKSAFRNRTDSPGWTAYDADFSLQGLLGTAGYSFRLLVLIKRRFPESGFMGIQIGCEMSVTIDAVRSFVERLDALFHAVLSGADLDIPDIVLSSA